MNYSSHHNVLFPEVLLLAYQNGYFPMAEEITQRIIWHRPDPRAVIPLDSIRIPRSLLTVIRKNTFQITVDTCFNRVVQQCAVREETWISEEIISAYTELHNMGYAHSVEAWQNGVLVGGLYGVAIGGAFFGESMFHKVSNSSKVAFAYLIDVLQRNHFSLLDTQYINSFTEHLGAIEISHTNYQHMLNQALSDDCTFV